jgi:hypothetical protein
MAVKMLSQLSPASPTPQHPNLPELLSDAATVSRRPLEYAKRELHIVAPSALRRQSPKRTMRLPTKVMEGTAPSSRKLTHLRLYR